MKRISVFVANVFEEETGSIVKIKGNTVYYKNVAIGQLRVAPLCVWINIYDTHWHFWEVFKTKYPIIVSLAESRGARIDTYCPEFSSRYSLMKWFKEIKPYFIEFCDEYFDF